MKKSLLRYFGLILPWLLFLEPQCQATNDSTLVNALREAVDGHASYRTFESIRIPTAGAASSDPIDVSEIAIADTVLEKRTHAHALLQKVLSGQRFLESLDALSEIELPVGVVKSGGDLDYTILVDRMQFTREGAVMEVYVSLAFPQTESRLAFHGKVPLSAKGGIAGNARVFLLGDHALKYNDNTLVTLKGTDRSYVEFDCSGFLGVNLDAEVAFSRDVIVPEDENGSVRDERLKIRLTTYTQSLNNILVSVTIPPFQVKGLRGFGFHATEAYLDWSDLANPPSLLFPATYVSPFLSAGLDNLWNGIYLKELEVRFPPSFARRTTAERLSVGAQEMIIDDLGITGALYIENALTDGDLNGWTYTLDLAAIQLTANQVTGFTLEGKLVIPVIKGRDGKRTEFSYLAQRGSEGNYLFSVDVRDELRLDLWMADIKLMQGSSVVVTERDNRFYPSAHLNGELSISISENGPNTSFNSVRFEGMVISSEAPYFRPGTFGFGREGHHSSIAKYPIVFDDITVKSQDKRVGLGFDILVNLGGKPEDESFAGKAGLVIWGTQSDEPIRDADGKVIGIDRYSWKFDKVELSSVRISIKKPKVIELVGEVRFFDQDRIYGEGFKGRMKGSIHSISVEAEALFGKTETFRYWYADALVELKTGIPVVPGVLSAFGFGGGYYSKMKQSDEPIDGTLGRSPSGITYVPDENTTGIKAIVLIGTPRPEAMRGDVALEVMLNRHGGINSVTFTGNASFMSTGSPGAQQIKELASAAVAGNLTEKLNSLAKGQVYGSVKLHFDNINDIFHGNLEIFVNVAGGMVRGVSNGNKAGWAVLHFEKHDWYIHIGTPDQPLGLEVARIFKAKSYFMLGKNLPGSPPPPRQVSEILGNVDLDYMRDLNALESGMGIAFGLHFLVDTGDLRFLMFYGRFSAGTGLDFMLKDYGNEYHCAGSSGPMGIDGWYANGQAYAFVMGKIGIRVNLRFYKGKYEILSIGAAAILQAKGPNPFWMKGMVGGYYRILGGLVKGRCRFEVTVGKECKPVAEQNLLEDVNLIAGVTPANSSADVSVFNAPQAVFNIPVGEVFEIRDMERQTHFFRAVLDEFAVLDGNRRISGVLKWNNEKDVVAFDAFDLLPGEKELNARVRISFEEKRNGVWTKVRFDGEVVIENAGTTFRTGKAPDFIPESNIAFSYPILNQLNFYPDEYPRGFIQLIDGQPDLFSLSAEWVQKVRMTERTSGQIADADLAYHAGTRRITFLLPDGLATSARYLLQIVNIPRTSVRVDQNVKKINRELMDEATGNSATLTTQSADGSLAMAETKAIFSSSFQTSQYPTFIEKMKNVDPAPVVRLTSGINIFQLTSYLRGEENLDGNEIGSTDNSLVRMEAILDGNRWYERYAYPLIYEDYPLLGWMKVRRPEPEKLGIPPVRDVYVENVKQQRFAGEDRIRTSVPFTNEYLVYNVGESVASDFYDMRRHAVNYVADHGLPVPPRIESLIVEPLPYIRHGRYRIKFSYVIPGIEQTTSSYEMEIFNRTPDGE